MDIDSYLSDMSNYRQTNKKRYAVDVTMPLIGTQVEFNQLNLSADISVTTAEKPFVITGLLGEKYVVSKAELFQEYTLLNDEDITDFDLRQRIVRVYKEGDLDTVYTVMYPLRIKAKKGMELLAIHIPITFQDAIISFEGVSLIANKIGMNHSLGDYVVRDMKLHTVRIVNGNLFPLMYNMKMFPNKRVYSNAKPIKNKEYKELAMSNMIIEVSDIPKVLGTRGIKRGDSDERTIEQGIIYRHVIREVYAYLACKPCIKLSELKSDTDNDHRTRYSISSIKVKDVDKVLKVGRIEFESASKFIDGKEVLCSLYRVISGGCVVVERMFSCTTKGMLNGMRAVYKDILDLIK